MDHFCHIDRLGLSYKIPPPVGLRGSGPRNLHIRGVGWTSSFILCFAFSFQLRYIPDARKHIRPSASLAGLGAAVNYHDERQKNGASDILEGLLWNLFFSKLAPLASQGRLEIMMATHTTRKAGEEVARQGKAVSLIYRTED